MYGKAINTIHELTCKGRVKCQKAPAHFYMDGGFLQKSYTITSLKVSELWYPLLW
jgi:hypothetical protein